MFWNAKAIKSISVMRSVQARSHDTVLSKKKKLNDEVHKFWTERKQKEKGLKGITAGGWLTAKWLILKKYLVFELLHAYFLNWHGEIYQCIK